MSKETTSFKERVAVWFNNAITWREAAITTIRGAHGSVAGALFVKETWPKPFDLTAKMDDWRNVLYWTGYVNVFREVKKQMVDAPESEPMFAAFIREKASNILSRARDEVDTVSSYAAMPWDETTDEQIQSFLKERYPVGLPTGDARRNDYSLDIRRVSPYFEGKEAAARDIVAVI